MIMEYTEWSASSRAHLDLPEFPFWSRYIKWLGGPHITFLAHRNHPEASLRNPYAVVLKLNDSDCRLRLWNVCEIYLLARQDLQCQCSHRTWKGLYQLYQICAVRGRIWKRYSKSRPGPPPHKIQSDLKSNERYSKSLPGLREPTLRYCKALVVLFRTLRALILLGKRASGP